MSTPTFGKLNAAPGSRAAPPAPEPRERDARTFDAQGGAPSSGFLGALDRLFMWLPNERNPGILAVLVFFSRQFLFAGIAMMLLLFGYVAFVGVGHLTLDSKFVLFGMILASGPLVLFEELGRYAFVRRAENPVRALAIFTGATAAVCALVFHSNLLVVAWTILGTVLASAAIYWGLGRRQYLAYIVAGLVVAHTTLYVVAPRSTNPGHASAAPQSLSAITPDPSENLAPTAPAVGEMPTWARLYPGATIVRSKTTTLLGLTSWRVTYSVPAGATDIDAFYQNAAQEAGFTDTETLMGMRRFRQKSTDNDFDYMLWNDPHGQLVVFEARTFGRSPDPAPAAANP